jgi:hypothetical protein
MTDAESITYDRWRRLVNMTSVEIRAFLGTAEGKSAHLTPEEALKLNMRRGRHSAKAVARMKQKGVSKWTRSDWSWARAQVAFIERMKALKMPIERNGKPTRLYYALKVWGHDAHKCRMST